MHRSVIDLYKEETENDPIMMVSLKHKSLRSKKSRSWGILRWAQKRLLSIPLLSNFFGESLRPDPTPPPSPLLRKFTTEPPSSPGFSRSCAVRRGDAPQAALMSQEIPQWTLPRFPFHPRCPLVTVLEHYAYVKNEVHRKNLLLPFKTEKRLRLLIHRMK